MGQDATPDNGRKSQGGSLRDRLRFAGLEQNETECVRTHRQTLEPMVHLAIRDFFQRLQSFPDAARNFSSERQYDRLHDVQSAHWNVLTDARFDSLYAERVKVLSDAESRMGLDPRWHIAGHAIVLETVVAGLIEQAWPSTVLTRGASRRDELLDLVRAFVRTVMVDVEIAVSLRFNELRQNHQRSLIEQRTGEQAAATELLTGLARKIEQRDFTRYDVDAPDVYTGPLSALNAALSDVDGQLDTFAERMATAETSLQTIAAGTGTFSGQAGVQASELAQTADTLHSIAARVAENSLETQRAEAAVTVTRQSAEKSGDIVGQAISAMADIENSAEKIGQIIGVIDEIAFQTNLLALNAGIEAARAGDSGRGFAVVAQEVRALAQRSGEAAREIKQLVTGTKAQVDAGVEMVARTQQSIGSIVQQVTDINSAVAGIARRTTEQATDLERATADVGRIGDNLRQACDGATHTRETCEDLHMVILELGETIRSFRIRRTSATGVVSRQAAATIPAFEPGLLDGDQDERFHINHLAALGA